MILDLYYYYRNFYIVGKFEKTIIILVFVIYNFWTPSLPSSQGSESNRGHGSSRNGSVSKRGVASSSQPNTSGAPSELGSRSTRLSGSGRPSSAQRIQPGYDKSSLSRGAAARSSRDDPVRSLELLSIGTEKRK